MWGIVGSKVNESFLLDQLICFFIKLRRFGGHDFFRAVVLLPEDKFVAFAFMFLTSGESSRNGMGEFLALLFEEVEPVRVRKTARNSNGEIWK